MALIDPPIDEAIVIQAFRANNAPEMSLLVNNWFADNPTLRIMDIELTATGAAPNFLCSLVAAAEGGLGSPAVLGAQAIATVIGGVSQIDALAMVSALGEAVRTLPDSDTLYKGVTAGGGAGPHWMALALTNGADA